ncbi:MAG: EAL domain-containing protein [Nitriliruptorales bacterium]|nr:EAL domain-containing protein [Nitriliruptorales bacterium]
MVRHVITAAVVVAIAAIAQLGTGALTALTVAAGAVTLAIIAVRITQIAADQPPLWKRGWLGTGFGATLMALATVSTVLEVDGATGALAVGGTLLAAWGVTGLLRMRLPGAAVFDIAAETVLVLPVAALMITAFTRAPSETYLPLLRDVGLLWMLARFGGLTSERPRTVNYLVGAVFILLFADAALLWEAIEPTVTITEKLIALPLWSLVLLAAGSLHPSLADRFADVSPSRSTEVRGSHLAVILTVVVGGPAAVVLDYVGSGTLGPWPFVAVGLGLPLLAAAHLVRQLHLRIKREYRAHHDPLTGLANRQLLDDRLSNELAHARRDRDRVAVMLLDLDRFKTINDSLGHDVGDGLLVAIARRLEESVREVDTVARLGGDEFAIVMPGIDTDQDALTVARKVREVFRDAFEVGTRELFVGTSIGVAIGPDDANDAKHLLKHADTAMYRAKTDGGGGIQFFTPEMSDRARVRLSLEGSLRNAVANDEFELYYQPQIDADSREIVALEALVRWQHPVLGTVSPGGFIPLAEETGAIIELGEWILQTACEQIAHWNDLGLLSVPVSVNVSGAQVVKEPLHELVERVLERTGLPGHLLEIELTETALFRDLDGITASLERLHEQGVRCAIDDFGAGYGGLTYLTQIPVDVIKIDRSFIADLEEDPRSGVVVDAVLAMAESLDVDIVAEGVETSEQVAWLRARGCRRMQGFRFARPIPRREMTRSLIHAQVGRPAGWRVTVSSLVAAEPDTSPVPAHREIPQGRINAVLAETARGHRGSSTDPDSLAAVLELLFPDGDPDDRRWAALEGVPVRLAIGTFAGLLPLTTGLADVQDLTDDARTVVSSVFDTVGVNAPAVDPDSGVDLQASLDGGAAELLEEHPIEPASPAPTETAAAEDPDTAEGGTTGADTTGGSGQTEAEATSTDGATSSDQSTSESTDTTGTASSDSSGDTGGSPETTETTETTESTEGTESTETAESSGPGSDTAQEQRSQPEQSNAGDSDPKGQDGSDKGSNGGDKKGGEKNGKGN